MEKMVKYRFPATNFLEPLPLGPPRFLTYLRYIAQASWTEFAPAPPMTRPMLPPIRPPHA